MQSLDAPDAARDTRGARTPISIAGDPAAGRRFPGASAHHVIAFEDICRFLIRPMARTLIDAWEAAPGKVGVIYYINRKDDPIQVKSGGSLAGAGGVRHIARSIFSV
jgi:hypothetical protein